MSDHSDHEGGESADEVISVVMRLNNEISELLEAGFDHKPIALALALLSHYIIDMKARNEPEARRDEVKAQMFDLARDMSQAVTFRLLMEWPPRPR